VKSPDTLKLQWDNFLAPFSLMLWVAMMATVLIIAIHLTLLYYLGQRYGNQEADEIKFYTFSDSLLLVLGIFCQQGETCLTLESATSEETSLVLGLQGCPKFSGPSR
jgi:hypothetical protein